MPEAGTMEITLHHKRCNWHGIFTYVGLSSAGLIHVTRIHNDKVPFLELKRLLHELTDLRPDICFRYRLIGETWQTNFLRTLQVTEKGAVLVDETSKKLHIIQDLSSIMQFELDGRFRQYEAHNHYTVEPTLVY